MDDFENKLKALLNEQIDHETRAHRAAPPLRRVTQAPKRSRRAAPWLMPLIAAACVAGVVLGGVGVTQLVSDRGNPAATEAPPGPTVNSTPRPTTSPTPAPSSTSSTTAHPKAGTQASTTTKSSPPAAPRHVINVDGAQISLPTEMTVKPYPGSPVEGMTRTCLGTSTSPTGCQLVVAQFPVPKGELNSIEVDALGGGDDMHHGDSRCNGGPPADTVERDEDRHFGGRKADWRQFDFTCPGSSTSVEFTQYVVPTYPAWVIYSDAPGGSQLLDGVAINSVLPAQTRPLRLEDVGYLRSAIRHGKTVRVSIDRTVNGFNGEINNSPVTYNYDVPADIYDEAVGYGTKIGGRILIRTDGWSVVSI